MLMVITSTPLVKCYLPAWHDALLNDPDRLFSKEDKFDFMIVHGCGAMKIAYNTPVLVSAKRKTDQDAEAKYKWLIGDLPNSQNETDWTGIVPFDPGFDLTERMYELTDLQSLASGDPDRIKKAQERAQKMMAETQKLLDNQRHRVEKESEGRVRRAMKTVHNNLIMQWQRNEENKLGKYPPSMSEMFGAHALAGSIDAENKKRAKMMERMNEISKNVSL